MWAFTAGPLRQRGMCTGARVRLAGTGVERAQGVELVRAGRGDGVQAIGDEQRPTDGGVRFVHADALEQGDQLQLLAFRVRGEHAEVGDHRTRAAAGEAGAGARAVAVEEAGAAAEVQPLDEAARGGARHHEHLPGMQRDLRRAAAARQPRGRQLVRADHGAVEVAEAVDLRGAEKAHVHASGLQVVAEYLRQRHHAGGGFGQLAVTDRQRQHVRPRADGAGFVDQHDLWRVGEAGQVAGGAGQADADEAHAVVAEQARGGHGHPLVAGAGAHAAVSACSEARKAWWSRVPSTWWSIQSRKRWRSRAIVSQRW